MYIAPISTSRMIRRIGSNRVGNSMQYLRSMTTFPLNEFTPLKKIYLGENTGIKLWWDGYNWISDDDSHSVRIVTSSTTLLLTDHLVLFDSSLSVTLSLFPATGTGNKYDIKSINGTVTIDGYESETIDGVTTQLIRAWETITIMDYTNGKWIII